MESGGEMIAPGGIFDGSAAGGGDCRKLMETFWAVDPFVFSSAVPGGVGSDKFEGLALNEVVRRCCLIRYDADRGSSGLLEIGGPDEPWPC